MINEDILNDLDQLQEGPSNHQIEEKPLATNHSELLQNTAFNQHMQQITKLIDSKIEKSSLSISHSESALINKSNQYAAEIDRQVLKLYKYVTQAYLPKFPELENIVTNPSQYCKAVLQIQKFYRSGCAPSAIEDVSFPYLNSHQTISLKISMSTPRIALEQKQSLEIIEVCQSVSLLSEHHNVLMIYLESSMQSVAPNLCQLVGSMIASKLISAAGGIKHLATMPACNIQVMGGQRSSQIGFAQMERNHVGIFNQMDVVKEAPKKFQMPLVRMMASNSAKCARADFLGTNSNLGTKLREEMYERFEKVQEEGGLMRIEKPLDIPGEQPKKKRGGKRYRKMKELYEMSEIRKQQNRMKFGQEAEEEIEDGKGLGLLRAGGRLNVPIKKQKIRVSKEMNTRMQKKSGLESSLNIAATQGIELINPKKQDERKGNDSYFSKEAGFSTVLRNKFSK